MSSSLNAKNKDKYSFWAKVAQKLSSFVNSNKMVNKAVKVSPEAYSEVLTGEQFERLLEEQLRKEKAEPLSAEQLIFKEEIVNCLNAYHHTMQEIKRQRPIDLAQWWDVVIQLKVEVNRMILKLTNADATNNPLPYDTFSSFSKSPISPLFIFATILSTDIYYKLAKLDKELYGKLTAGEKVKMIRNSNTANKAKKSISYDTALEQFYNKRVKDSNMKTGSKQDISIRTT